MIKIIMHYNYEFNFSYFCLKAVLTNYGQILGFKENASLL